MNEGNIRNNIQRFREILVEHGLLETGSEGCPSFDFSGEIKFDLYVSRVINYALNNDAFVDRWIDTRLKKLQLVVSPRPLHAIDKWHIDQETGNIMHETGRFFTITGLKVRHRMKSTEIEWDQPIIDQPEVGILGILVKKIHGVLHFCLQAKEEPGNINGVQLAPTVQATYSNYTQVHGGKLPPFIDLFLAPPKEKLLFSKLEPEDGGRFLYKSNKNMLVLAAQSEYEDLPEEFIWLTLRQVAGLLERDNLINSCTRSVLACLI